MRRTGSSPTACPSKHPDDHYWFGDGDNEAKVGYSGTWEPKAVTVHSYIQFDVSTLAGKDIVTAEFNISC